MFDWFKKAPRKSERFANDEVRKRDSQPAFVYSTSNPEFSDDGTIRVRWSFNSVAECVDGYRSVEPGSADYGFWCWLLAQPKYRGGIAAKDLAAAEETYNRILHTAPVVPSVETNSTHLTNEEAESICQSFTRSLADAKEAILDERRLAFPKAMISAAFEQQIEALELRLANESNPRKQKHWDVQLDRHRAVKLHISDFQMIDRADEEAIQQANAGLLGDGKTLLLVAKYHQRGMKELGMAIGKDPIERDGEIVSFAELCKRFRL